LRALLFCGPGGESRGHGEKQEKRNEKSLPHQVRGRILPDVEDSIPEKSENNLEKL